MHILFRTSFIKNIQSIINENVICRVFVMVHCLQVGCGKDLTLFALEQGRVIITVERLSPYPNSPMFAAVKAGRTVLRKFYHVIPEPQRETFKLVSQI